MDVISDIFREVGDLAPRGFGDEYSWRVGEFFFSTAHLALVISIVKYLMGVKLIPRLSLDDHSWFR